MSNLGKKEFLDILDKHHKGTASPEEEAFLNAYFNIFELDQDYFEGLTPIVQDEMSARLKAKIDGGIASSMEKTSGFRKAGRRWIAVAASLVLIASAYLYFSPRNQLLKPDTTANQELPAEILPGGNKATLTLANGRKISLTDAANGNVASDNGIKIVKTKDGELIYEIVATDDVAVANSFHTIQTPRGGEYRINLPDGTKVMLNAASSLKFPVSFASRPQRVVELTGEAYFEVAHNENQPFKVISSNQEIQVLGTDFNVNAYADEPATVTTLVKGSVKVFHDGKSQLIKPFESAVVSKGIRVRQANDSDLAWKNGIISFRNASIESIMRQVARWYDVEVSIGGKIPERLFTGEISRSSNLSDLIAIFESSNIKFRFNKRHITLIP
ncbi:MAG: DUF4974 domain-containing protein [Pedobacter sp.]|nr:MAG: DUF4974 domain-containing protein [Pedobacter sp.]